MDLARFHQETSRLEPGAALGQCYSQGELDCETLQRYYENLSRRADEASVVASALICFDLAANHDEAQAKSQYPYILEELRAAGRFTAFREQLVGTEPALVALWKIFAMSILQADPRFEPGRDEVSIDDLSDVEIVEEEPELQGEPSWK